MITMNRNNEALIGKVIKNENLLILGTVVAVESEQGRYDSYQVVVLDSGRRIRVMDLEV